MIDSDYTETKIETTDGYSLRMSARRVGETSYRITFNIGMPSHWADDMIRVEVDNGFGRDEKSVTLHQASGGRNDNFIASESAAHWIKAMRLAEVIAEQAEAWEIDDLFVDCWEYEEPSDPSHHIPLEISMEELIEARSPDYSEYSEAVITQWAFWV